MKKVKKKSEKYLKFRDFPVGDDCGILALQNKNCLMSYPETTTPYTHPPT